MKYHMTADIEGAMKNDNMTLVSMFKTVDGRLMMACDIRQYLQELLNKGYEVVPPCDNHDERGYCKGHEEEPK